MAAEADARRVWLLHARALARGVVPTVPTVVLAQAWRGGPQPSLARFLGSCLVEPLSEVQARAAGRALARSGTADVVDAVVVVGAIARQDAVVSGDRFDLARIAAGLSARLSIIDV